MAINKVAYGNNVLIDLSTDTLSSADQLMQGVVAHDRTGAVITGTGTSGTPAIAVTEEPDTGGGVIKNITALDISDTTAVAEDVAQGKYFYTAGGVKTVGTASAGGGGLEYEEGTWTPEYNVSRGYVPFSNTHTSLPFYVAMVLDEEAFDSTLSTGIEYFIQIWALSPGSIRWADSSTVRYGMVRYTERRTSSTSVSSGTAYITQPLSSTSQSTNAARYSVDETGFYPYGSTQAYWRVGYKYKWIAVWAPTT